MLSRAAEAIYWMSRYVERAENVARFIDVNLNLTLDAGAGAGDQWSPLVAITGDHVRFAELYGQADQPSVIQFLTFDPKNPNAILPCLRAARENARAVREMISAAMWEEINKFYLMVKDAARQPLVLHSMYDFFQEIKRTSHLLKGITDATMSHGEAWHFARLGRMLERADKTSRILDVKYFLLLPAVDAAIPLDTVQWLALLKSASALEMYRQRYGRIAPVRVVEFLALDRQFPRAIAFCLLNAEESMLAITGSAPGEFNNPAERRLGGLRAEFESARIGEVMASGLHQFIDRLQVELNATGDAIGETFFAPQPMAVMSQTQSMGPTASQRQQLVPAPDRLTPAPAYQ